MKYEDIDSENRIWSALIPKRTKYDEFRLDKYITDPLKQVIDEAQSLKPKRLSDTPYVFPARNGDKSICETAIRKLMKKYPRQGDNGKITMHGFRSTFMAWSMNNEKNDLAVERELSHTVGGGKSKTVGVNPAVRRAYDRDDLFHVRKDIAIEYADFVTSEVR